MNLKKIGKVFTSKSVGTGPSSYEKRIYRAAVSQRLRNSDVERRVWRYKLRRATVDRENINNQKRQQRFLILRSKQLV